MNRKQMITGLVLIVVFLLQQSAGWLLGKLLDALPLPKNATGAIDVTAIPWGAMIGWLSLIAGIILLFTGWQGKDIRLPWHRSNEANLDLEAIAAEIEKQIASLPGRSMSPTTDEARALTHLKAQLQQHGESITMLNDLIVDNQISITKKVEAIATAQSDLEKRLLAMCASIRETLNTRFANVDFGFRAIRDRERLSELAEQMAVFERVLLLPKQGVAIDNWKHWETARDKWHKLLGAYHGVADRYLPDLLEKVSTVSAERLRGEWPEDPKLFPNEDWLIRYRTFAIAAEQFTREHDEVMHNIQYWAYQSPSKKDPPSH
jgi:hypothetical protein